MIKNTKYIIAAFFIFFCHACGELLPEAELGVLVLDEEKFPISNAKLVTWFPEIYGAGSSAKGKTPSDLTNAEGRASVKETTAGSVSFSVRKEGYYYTGGGKIDFIGMHAKGKALKAERTLIMKKIKNPIPLYARQLRHVKIPSLNAPFGFDLEIGDWVTPHGEGKTTDMIFQIRGTHESYREYDLTLEVSFPNEGDGLVMFEGAYEVGSALRSDHLAPKTGYQPTLVLKKKALYEQKSSQWLNDSKSGSNYYLRTRTELDEKGDVIRANYGKIYGNFDFLDFIKAEAYYFNPTVNDRNVEFDTKRNLANPSKSFEKVLMP
jgi:hypothetical protein